MSADFVPVDDHDRILLSHVRPPEWNNPEPAKRYNLVVIGAGTAGLVSAAAAAGLGARVALVERSLMGGDCLNVGCVPSKALIRAARAASEARHAGRFGVQGATPSVDFSAVMGRMRRLRADISPHDSAARFRSLGVDVFLGQARFLDETTVEAAGARLTFRRCVIATGSSPALPSIPGLREITYLTNETVFSLTELPGRLAVLGAGPIGCELAQAFARFGSRVSLVVNGHRVLGKEDPAAVEIVRLAMGRDGVRLMPDETVERVSERGPEKVLHLRRPDGSTDELIADRILVATGRVPNIRDLGLDAAGVGSDENGVIVNDRLRTTNPRIFAAGDVCSAAKFTHAADAMARIAIRNALFLGRSRFSDLRIPRCTYTDPEVATVGPGEEELARMGVPYDVYEQRFDHVDRAILDGESGGFAKVLTKKGRDTILGATLVAAHAGEMISEVTVAMRAGLGLRDLAEVIHPYPTQAEALKKIADAYNRTRLTPTIKWLFEKWLSLRR